MTGKITGKTTDKMAGKTAGKTAGNMSEKAQDRQGTGPASREDRLKAALKANMARRKQQARARSAAAGDGPASHQDAKSTAREGQD